MSSTPRSATSPSSARTTWPRSPIDLLGVNYYKSWGRRAAPLPPPAERAAMDLGVEVRVPPGAETTGFRWAVCPDGLRDLLVGLTAINPNLPLLHFTENGFAYDDYAGPDGEVRDVERISFVQRYLSAAAQAIAAGVDLAGTSIGRCSTTSSGRRATREVRAGVRRLPHRASHPQGVLPWYRDLVAAHPGGVGMNRFHRTVAVLTGARAGMGAPRPATRVGGVAVVG